MGMADIIDGMADVAPSSLTKKKEKKREKKKKKKTPAMPMHGWRGCH